MRSLYVITALIISLIYGSVAAQSSIIDIKSELLNINKAYDSAFFLSFDVNLSYSTDTSGKGDFDRSELNGHYLINGRNALYYLDKIEYMQNEKFTVVVYNDDHFILVGKPRQAATGSLLPYRQVIDSFIAKVDTTYSFEIVNGASDSNRKTMLFTAVTPDNVTSEKIRIEYDSKSFLIQNIYYEMKETNGEYGVESVGLLNARKARFNMSFSRYRVEPESEGSFGRIKVYLFRKSI